MEDESRLIRRVKFGSRKDADKLVRGYYDEIFVYVFRQISDRDAAMDMTQEIFISMLRTIHTFDRKKASFRTWLYRIAENKIIDFLRSRRRAPFQCDIDEIDIAEEVSLSEVIENDEFLLRLKNYIEEFDDENQKIFQMKFFEECTLVQIAEAVNLPESTVKSKYYRMLKKIKTDFFGRES